MQPNLLADDDVYESTDRHHAQGDQNHGQSNQELPARVDHIDISQVSRVPSWGCIESLRATQPLPFDRRVVQMDTDGYTPCNKDGDNHTRDEKCNHDELPPSLRNTILVLERDT